MTRRFSPLFVHHACDVCSAHSRVSDSYLKMDCRGYLLISFLPLYHSKLHDKKSDVSKRVIILMREKHLIWNV